MMKIRTKRILLSFLSLLLLLMPIAVKAESTDDMYYVKDEANLMSEEEQEELETKLSTISDYWGEDVVVLTANSLEGKTAEAYADDYYDMNGYGVSGRNGGILLLVAMDDRKWHMSTGGECISIFTDAGLNYMQEQFKPSLSEGDYAEAFNTFADLCDDFMAQAETGEPYDTGNLPKEPLSILWYIGAVAVAFLLAFIWGSIEKGKLTTVREKQTASDYAVAGSLNVYNSHDQMVRTYVTQRALPKEDSSSSSGSSTHTSSSGSSHGGCGGSF